MSEPITHSVITCPHCGGQAKEEMPLTACMRCYDCTYCGETLRPKKGECCVFCSYGSVPCPPVQQTEDGSCCGEGCCDGY